MTADRWPDLEAFAGRNGLYSNCWCVWWRRTSSGRALLDGAVSYAFGEGAASVEAYPIDNSRAPTEPSILFTGTLSMFTDAGFDEVRGRGSRPTVRLDRSRTR